MRKFPATLTILIALTFANASLHAAPPTLQVPENFSWKGIFDARLRPKHVAGLEHLMIECRNQELNIQIGENPEPFPLDAGMLSIRLMVDNEVRLFRHVSRVPISMEEGKARLERFRAVLADHLVRPGSLPVVMDERSGSVRAVSDQHAVAKIEHHVFSYGFTSSHRKDQPLIPIFQLAWVQFAGEDSPAIRRERVAPPAGYEWYSLDPNVEIPDPDPAVELPPAEVLNREQETEKE